MRHRPSEFSSRAHRAIKPFAELLQHEMLRLRTLIGRDNDELAYFRSYLAPLIDPNHGASQ
jgi:hypothetical protein